MKDIFKFSFTSQDIGKDTGMASPNPIITFSINSFVEDNEANSFQKILLDNISMPINVSLLSNPKILNSNSGIIGNNENINTNDSHVKIIEKYINQQLNQGASMHLKN